MSDLLQKIKLGTNNVKLIKWPSSDQEVLIRVLSQQEMQEAVFATERLFKKENIEVNLITSDEYDNEKATQVLYRAIKDPTDNKSICANITEFRASLTKEEKLYLIQEYLTFEKDCSPRPDNMSSEEFDKFLAEVKKNPSLINSSSLSCATLRSCITTLASQLETSLRLNASSSLPSKKPSIQKSSDQLTR
jgi:hypothetical protein